MITKEELKREVDQLPESLLEEAHSLLQKIILHQKTKNQANNWTLWVNNLNKFTPDFMNNRDQSNHQEREAFD